MYKRQEVYEATLKYFNNDELPTNVWIDKYCLKDRENNYLELTPDDMHKRLAKEFARIEQKYENPLSYEEIYDLLRNFDYIIPGGSILYGVGNNYSISSIGNCFVIGNDSDSYGGICTTDQEQCQLHKRRSGVGHDLSHIRPKDSLVTNSAGTSTGVLPFMERYSNSTREVAQDGRRGATMLSININHPDIEEFITSKSDLTKITGANISVKVDDEFMKAVEENKDFRMTWNKQYGLVKDGSKSEGDKTILIEAKKLWDKLIHQATTTAEPGILFWDTIKKESIPSCYGEEWEETSTNPCGEIPLCPYDSCRLMSVNLYSFVDNPFTDKASFNYDKFKDVVYKAQRLMDDVVDLEEEKINKILEKIENDPEPEEIKVIEKNLWIKIKKKLLEGRRTGLSGIGLGDVFGACNLVYGSDDSIKLAEEIYKQFAISAYKSSIDMAKERGAFPIFDIDKEALNSYLQRLVYHKLETKKHEDNRNDYRWKYEKYGRRNIALLTIPPSGSISMFGNKNGISSGIEPVYQLSYKRRRKVNPDNPNKSFQDQNGDWWEEYNVYHPKLKDWYIANFPNESFDWQDLTKSLLEKSSYHNSTAYEIDPLQRVKLQATIQKWIDHSISSTINLKKGTSEEEVSNLYMEAWKQGCKGLTIYVDESRTGVLVSNKTNENKEFKQNQAPKRPKSLACDIYQTVSKGKKWLVIVGILDQKPYEIFAIENTYDLPKGTSLVGNLIKIKRGVYSLDIKDILYIDDISTDMTDEEEAITRLISTSLRHGSDIKFVVEQLNKTRGDLQSFTKGISRILKRYIPDETEVSGDICPDCGDNLIYKDGCVSCNSCSYSKCG